MALSRAQSLDAQADSLSSQGHFLKAKEKREEAAIAYEAAAQSTADPSARRTLLMLATRQRANAEVLERKASVSSNAARAQSQQGGSGSGRTGQLRPRTAMASRTAQDGLTTLQASRKQLEGASHRRLLRDNSNSQLLAQSTSPSMMMESSRRSSDSTSPSHSPNASIYPEGSFMVLRDDSNDADPFRRFNQAVDALLGQMSSPVAFATLPLDRAPKSKQPVIPRTQVPETSTAEESFYVVSGADQVPSSSTSAAFLPSRHRHSSGSTRGGSAMSSTKTVEELTQENATLKEALNNLSLQYEQAISSQKQERETLKQSILSLRTDIRKESDRVLRVSPGQQSTVLNNTASQSPTIEETDEQDKPPKQDLQAEVDRLKSELHSAKASAQKYKNRYDQLREAIKEKRMNKQAADAAKLKEQAQQQAAAAQTPDGTVQTPAPSEMPPAA